MRTCRGGEWKAGRLQGQRGRWNTIFSLDSGQGAFFVFRFADQLLGCYHAPLNPSASDRRAIRSGRRAVAQADFQGVGDRFQGHSRPFATVGGLGWASPHQTAVSTQSLVRVMSGRPGSAGHPKVFNGESDWQMLRTDRSDFIPLVQHYCRMQQGWKKENIFFARCVARPDTRFRRVATWRW